MRMMMLWAAAALAGAPGAALAAETGEYGATLRRIVTEAAAGRCVPEVMAQALLTACREQLPTMGPGLAALGAVEGVTFVRSEEREGKRLETYAVKHAGGKTMLWTIGAREGDKFAAVYSLGD